MVLLQAGSQSVSVLVLYVIVFLGIFYFMMLRPQQGQARRRREMLSKLKKGDRIVTVGGLHATIADVDGDQLTLDLGSNMRVKADRSAVNYIRGKKDRDAGSATTP